MKNQSGFSLLELVISLAIFAIGFLGIMKMQTLMIRDAYSAMLRAQAQVQLLDLIEQTRVLPKPDLAVWSSANTHYFPRSHGGLSDTYAYLQWQPYAQPEAIMLQVVN